MSVCGEGVNARCAQPGAAVTAADRTATEARDRSKPKQTVAATRQDSGRLIT